MYWLIEIFVRYSIHHTLVIMLHATCGVGPAVADFMSYDWKGKKREKDTTYFWFSAIAG